MSKYYEMEQYSVGNITSASFFLPDMGNFSISYQDVPLGDEGEKELALYVDFDISKITIIDSMGNDHKVRGKR